MGRQRAARHARLLKVRAWVKSYLKTHPCVDCGQDDIRVLEFDHIDPRKKLFGISRGVKDGRGLKSVQAEIEKCEVRCCNCHRIRTTQEKHWQLYRETYGGQEGASPETDKDSPGAGSA